MLKNQEKELDKKRGDLNIIRKDNDSFMIKHEKLNHFLQDEEENLTLGQK